MQIAMTLPTMLPHGRAESNAWCRAIDDGPWSSLAVPERVTYPRRCAVDALAAAGCDELFLVPTTAEPAALDRTRDALGL